MTTTLSTRGLSLPLKHAEARNKRGGGSLGSEERANPARRRLDCPQRRGLRVLLWSLGFVSWRSKKGRPSGGCRTKINVPKALKTSFGWRLKYFISEVHPPYDSHFDHYKKHLTAVPARSTSNGDTPYAKL